MGLEMAIEVDLPKDLELTIKANRELDILVRKRIERQLAKDIKNDIFFSRTLDDLLIDSDLDEEDIAEIDHKIKRGIMEKLRWRL
jgi:hypothetical protein